MYRLWLNTRTHIDIFCKFPTVDTYLSGGVEVTYIKKAIMTLPETKELSVHR